jgi:hypothetical protein
MKFIVIIKSQKPKAKGGGDEYKNLVIIHKDVHKLIHLKDEKKIYELEKELKLDESQNKKLLKLKSLIV